MSFYSGKTVLVTGADGFIGSHLSSYLASQGARVKALAWYHPRDRKGWLSDSAQRGIDIIRGDIRDPFQAQEMVSGCDCVFHLAALITIPYSYEAPASYLQTNVLGTHHLLEAARKTGASFLLMSTSEVYGSALEIPMPESHPLQPQSPYSASKIGAEAIVRSYYYSYEMPVFVARVFNTYGPRQSERAIIPTVIQQINSGASSLKLGDLSPTRDFVYVEDTCRCLAQLVQKPSAIGLPVNICTGKEESVETLVLTLRKMLASTISITQDPARLRPPNSEVSRLCGSPALLQSLGIIPPQTNLREGLRKTIDWFQLTGSYQSLNSQEYHV